MTNEDDYRISRVCVIWIFYEVDMFLSLSYISYIT